jgi:hypothetical protein
VVKTRFLLVFTIFVAVGGAPLLWHFVAESR